jgi:hypothetical protein
LGTEQRQYYGVIIPTIVVMIEVDNRLRQVIRRLMEMTGMQSRNGPAWDLSVASRTNCGRSVICSKDCEGIFNIMWSIGDGLG